jgi:hypothetical protein
MMLKPDDPGFIEGFDWGLYPECERFLFGWTERFLRGNGFAASLSRRMEDAASTRFFDWIDHLALPEKEVDGRELERLGYEEVDSKELPDGGRLFKHTKTEFFPLLLSRSDALEAAIKPEEIDGFLQIVGRGAEVEGAAHAPLRKAVVCEEGGFILSAVERRGSNGYVVREGKDIGAYDEALSAFCRRRRRFQNDAEGLEATLSLVRGFSGKLGAARLADAFLRPERRYWQSRNRAGAVQKSRQDTLGLGWGNHDHHTYRSSRENFSSLIRIFEMMGYICREKFYAGEEAGWGAQILEHPVCDVVLFADVDLFKEETEVDFPHSGLGHRRELGTVGLWIGLHGESILQAGMHHLEARFDFERLRKDLPSFGVDVMRPFSDFDFLKQAFTQGERWEVDPGRVEALLEQGSITREQAERFRKEGAVGSHLENLQRNQGFKGFNQKSVSAILRITDPRNYKIEHA